MWGVIIIGLGFIVAAFIITLFIMKIITIKKNYVHNARVKEMKEIRWQIYLGLMETADIKFFNNFKAEKYIRMCKSTIAMVMKR